MESKESGFGPVAKQHELDFYGQNMDTEEGQSYYTAEEINLAFSMTRRIEPNEEPYPWDLIDSNKFCKYSVPYGSLNDGNWVEDEILERCMKILAKEKSAPSASICILESYIMNWAAKKSYDDGNLIDLILEKNIMNQAKVAVLMNTDLRGSGGHWILGIVNMIEKQIIIFDTSVVFSPTFYEKYFFYLLHILHVANELNGSFFNPNAFKLIISLDSIQQNNANDCGPFVVANFYGVLTNRQVSTRPNGLKVRKWIHDVIHDFNSKSIDSETLSKTNQNGVNVKKSEDIPSFNPSGLKYTYEKTHVITSKVQVDPNSGPLISLL